MGSIVCKKCGTNLQPGSKFCINCGEAVAYEHYEGNNAEGSQVKTKFCSHCGKSILADAYVCPNCGNSTNYKTYGRVQMATDEKNNVVAGLLAIFLGTLGIHKFYLGNIAMGIFYLLITFFGFLFFCIPNLILEIVVIVEGILYLIADNQAFNEKYNKNYRG